jgi:hypothetical protein
MSERSERVSEARRARGSTLDGFLLGGAIALVAFFRARARRRHVV